ncbi:TPA: hypothetical protein N0F65_009010, partial [Lagenidium giganteum]
MSELFSFADTTDKILMGVGLVGALTAGISQPIQIVLFGDILNTLNPAKPPVGSEMRDNINKAAKRIRSAYVSAILTKEIGWFDVNEPMQLATKVADSTVTIQEGMGRKVGDGLHFFSMAVSGIIIGLVKGWQ